MQRHHRAPEKRYVWSVESLCLWTCLCNIPATTTGRLSSRTILDLERNTSWAVRPAAITTQMSSYRWSNTSERYGSKLSDTIAATFESVRYPNSQEVAAELAMVEAEMAEVKAKLTSRRRFEGICCECSRTYASTHERSTRYGSRTPSHRRSRSTRTTAAMSRSSQGCGWSACSAERQWCDRCLSTSSNLGASNRNSGGHGEGHYKESMSHVQTSPSAARSRNVSDVAASTGNYKCSSATHDATATSIDDEAEAAALMDVLKYLRGQAKRHGIFVNQVQNRKEAIMEIERLRKSLPLEPVRYEISPEKEASERPGIRSSPADGAHIPTGRERYGLAEAWQRFHPSKGKRGVAA